MQALHWDIATFTPHVYSPVCRGSSFVFILDDFGLRRFSEVLDFILRSIAHICCWSTTAVRNIAVPSFAQSVIFFKEQTRHRLYYFL